ncbi:ABC transporter permease [Paenibacillaceae bacterium]|nr:ABC transporter permease [Paenibacillaceae bacterium]
MGARLKHNRRAMLGLWMVICFAAVALLAPWIAPYDPLKHNMQIMLEPPAWSHPLGTDEFGRDILSRLMYGMRLSLIIGLVSVTIAATVGIALGLISGYFGGWVDRIIMRVVDVLLAFPNFLLAIVVVSALGPGIVNMTVSIGLFSMPAFARVARGAVLGIKQQDYVQAAVAMGSGHFRIIWSHVLPNSAAQYIVLATLRIATAILTTSGLSFLGLGAPPPTPEWGAMLSTGREFMRIAPHVSLMPGIAILLTVLAFNMLGDGLRDAFDPKMKLQHHAGRRSS